MRADRIAKRWNLKSRAKSGKYLLHWQDRLNQGAMNLYKAGFDAGTKSMNPPPPTETTHSDGLHTVDERSTSGGSFNADHFSHADLEALNNRLIDADKDSHL